MQVIEPADGSSFGRGSRGDYTRDEVRAMQRTVPNILERWGVSDAEAAVILGGISPKTLRRWKGGEYGRVNRDLADRMSYLLGIHKALRIIFAEPAAGYAWMRRPNESFNGAMPLELLAAGGMEDLMRLRRYLEFGAGRLVTAEAALDPPRSRVAWPRTHRLVLAQYPPIDLYDDVADPHDWEALAAAQARTNPGIYEQIGDLSRVPPERRISGDGASWVMAAFTHVSFDRRSRFSDGSYGVYYAGESLETALYEHSFHMGVFYARSNMPASWISEVRQLVGTVDAVLLDLRGRGFEALLDPGDYAASQAFAARRCADGADGFVYPSVRRPGGECIAALWPDVVGLPVQGEHFRYFWNGRHVAYARQITGTRRVFELRPA